MKKHVWGIAPPSREVIVDLKRFEKTDLERDLDRTFGTLDRSIHDDVYKTYSKAMGEFGTRNVKVKTDLLPPQIYKVFAEEIEIVN